MDDDTCIDRHPGPKRDEDQQYLKLVSDIFGEELVKMKDSIEEHNIELLREAILSTRSTYERN